MIGIGVALFVVGAIVLILILSSINDTNTDTTANANLNTVANSANNAPDNANAEVYVDQIYMAKDADGQPGEKTTTFETGDRMIYCVAKLNKSKAGTKVRFVLKAVDAAGLKNEETIVTNPDYTTHASENPVYWPLSLSNNLRQGTYRVDVYINGTLDKTTHFTIR